MRYVLASFILAITGFLGAPALANAQLQETSDTVTTDTDNDGIPDVIEGSDSETPTDSDSDTVPDYLEPNTIDTDGDGQTNNVDSNDDGDASSTAEEVAPEDSTLVTEPDGEVVADADNDTVPDYLEPNTTDTDNDGLTNNVDADDDGDSLLTTQEDVVTVGQDITTDTDGDLIPNYLDSDDDGDGVATLSEDTNNDGTLANDDSDRDSVPNYLESSILDTDHDGLVNSNDADDDGDGTPTIEEVVYSSAEKEVILLDSDRDRVPDYLEPNSARLSALQIAGLAGLGILAVGFLFFIRNGVPQKLLSNKPKNEKASRKGRKKTSKKRR